MLTCVRKHLLVSVPNNSRNTCRVVKAAKEKPFNNQIKVLLFQQLAQIRLIIPKLLIRFEDMPDLYELVDS